MPKTPRRLLSGLKPLDPKEAAPEPPKYKGTVTGRTSARTPLTSGYMQPIGFAGGGYVRPDDQWQAVWRQIDTLRSAGALTDTEAAELTAELEAQQAQGLMPAQLQLVDGETGEEVPIELPLSPAPGQPFLHVTPETYRMVIDHIRDADCITISADPNGNETAIMGESGDDPGLHCFVDDLGQCWVHPDAYAHLADQTGMEPGVIDPGAGHMTIRAEDLQIIDISTIGVSSISALDPREEIRRIIQEQMAEFFRGPALAEGLLPSLFDSRHRAVAEAILRIGGRNGPAFNEVDHSTFTALVSRVQDRRTSSIDVHTFYFSSYFEMRPEQMVAYTERTGTEPPFGMTYHVRSDIEDFCRA